MSHGNSSVAWSLLLQVCETGRAVNRSGVSFDVFPSSVRLEVAEALRDLVKSENAARTLEIGLAHGLSALAICAGTEHQPGASHTAIDPLQRSHYGGVAIDLLATAGALDRVTVIETPSKLALPRLIEDRGPTFDFAFVDGDHHFESIVVDLLFVQSLVRPGSLVVIDDIWMESVALAVRHFERNLGWSPCPSAAARHALRNPDNADRLRILRTPEHSVSTATADFISPCADPAAGLPDRSRASRF